MINVQGLSKTASSTAKKCAGHIRRKKIKGELLLDVNEVDCMKTNMDEEMEDCDIGWYTNIKKYELKDGTKVTE